MGHSVSVSTTLLLPLTSGTVGNGMFTIIGGLSKTACRCLPGGGGYVAWSLLSTCQSSWEMPRDKGRI